MTRIRIFAMLLFLAAMPLCGTGCSGLGERDEKGRKMEPRINIVTLGVSDLHRSAQFYKDGLGFPTKMATDGGIVIFSTSGAKLSLYPNPKLAEDVGPGVSHIENKNERFPGFVLGHCVRRKEDVDAILLQAQKAGGKIVKAAHNTFWGGYGGYFADPDGYLWEVAYSDQWKFNADGSLLMGD